MSELLKIITCVEQEIASLRAASGKFDPDKLSDWHEKRRELTEALSHRLGAEFGAAITEKWNGARVRISGITSSSTSGIEGALNNWIVSARRKAAAR